MEADIAHDVSRGFIAVQGLDGHLGPNLRAAAAKTPRRIDGKAALASKQALRQTSSSQAAGHKRAKTAAKAVELLAGTGPVAGPVTGPRGGFGALALRRERNERRAKFRDGELNLPPPVVLFDHSVPIVATARFVTPAAFLFRPPPSDAADAAPSDAPKHSSSSSSSSSSASSSSVLPFSSPSFSSFSSSSSSFTSSSSSSSPSLDASGSSEPVSLAFRLPVAPARAQVVTMRAAAAAVAARAVGLLESPTGTGKTLALLAAALECQRTVEERRAKARAAREAAKGAKEAARAALGTFEGAVKEEVGEEAEEEEEEETPRVVWVARTHDQLEHAVHEFKRLPYRPVMSLRLSRER